MRFARQKKPKEASVSLNGRSSSSTNRPVPQSRLEERVQILATTVDNIEKSQAAFSALQPLYEQMSSALELESLARNINDSLTRLQGEIESQLSAVVSLRNECAAVDPIDTGVSSENLSTLQALSAKVESESQTSQLKNVIVLKTQEVESKKEVLRVLEECEEKLKAFQKSVETAKEEVTGVGSLHERTSELIARADRDKAQALQSLEEDALYGWNKGKNYLEDELNAEVDRAVADLEFYLKSEVGQLESYLTQQLLSLSAQYSSLQSDIHESELKQIDESSSQKAGKILEAFTEETQQRFEELTSSAKLANERIIDLSQRFQQFTAFFKTLAPSNRNEERSRAKLEFVKLYAAVDKEIEAFENEVSGFDLSSKSSLYDLVELGENLKAHGEASFASQVRLSKDNLGTKLKKLLSEAESLKSRLSGVERTLEREVQIKLLDS